LIPINLPKIDEEEINSVVKVLRSGILTSGLGAGPMVTLFEEKYAKFADVKHAIAVNTGTAALHEAVVAAGVEPGDEVILPSFTFVATAEAVVMAGGKPVFTDIDPETYNLSPTQIENAITAKTKAIIPVDLYGYPSDISPIREITLEHKISIIEDAAQAHGSELQNKSAGYFSDVACWSLYASKNMTTGEGGVITTDDDQLAERMRMLRTHGEKAKYASQMLGFNYRMSEIQAALGVVQLEKLPLFAAKRRANAQQLTKILLSAERLILPREPEDGRHSWYLYTVRIRDATETQHQTVVDQLRKKDIGAEVYYANPVHMMPYYRDTFGVRKLPETEKAAKQVISLPIHPGVTPEQLDYIGNSLLGLL
jgi:perosamine synthetase